MHGGYGWMGLLRSTGDRRYYCFKVGSMYVDSKTTWSTGCAIFQGVIEHGFGCVWTCFDAIRCHSSLSLIRRSFCKRLPWVLPN